MVDSEQVAAHYGLGGLHERFERAFESIGHSPTVASLGAADEFHIGGRPATSRLLDQMDLTADMHVLDLGSGIGGTARHLASTTGARVTGIDLTTEYVDVANWLTGLVALDQVEFRQGSVLDLPFGQSSFDAATMVHVGMNIDDKVALCQQVARTLRPGAPFAIYDIMTASDGDLAYPVPWAASASSSFVEPPVAYVRALEAAGFRIETVTDCTDAAASFFAAASKGAPPGPLGLHLVMGPDTKTKVANMVANLRNGLIAPTEIIARR